MEDTMKKCTACGADNNMDATMCEKCNASMTAEEGGTMAGEKDMGGMSSDTSKPEEGGMGDKMGEDKKEMPEE